MNNAKSLTRITALVALMTLGIVCMMAEDNGNGGDALMREVLSKVVAIAALWAGFRLYTRWAATDKWLKAYQQWCDKALEE